MAVAFANIFMNEVETNMESESKIKPIIWKRYIDNVFSLWDVPKRDIDLLACLAGVQRGGRGEVECEREARSLGVIDLFIQQANAFHPTIKFTAEISEQ